MKEIAIVILNWNGKKHLERYLPSVVSHSNGVDIVLIDNYSTDESVTFLKENYPTIQIIQNKDNEGFAKGYNDGLKVIEGKYNFYILLNSDVEVTPNWIVPLHNKILADDFIAAVQPKILAEKNRNYFEHAGAAGGFIDKNGYPFCRGRIFNEVEEDKGQYDQEIEIFWATGACMFVRASVFHELGGFDSDYFAHMEEIDLCWRMKLLGYKIYCIPKSMVYHLGGGTLDYTSPKKVYLNFRNSLFTLYKNYTGNFLFGKIIQRFMLDYIAVGFFLLKLDFKAIKEVYRAQFHFSASIKTLKVKRSKIQNAVKTKNVLEIYPKSIVWSFFLFKKKRFSELNIKTTDK